MSARTAPFTRLPRRRAAQLAAYEPSATSLGAACTRPTRRCGPVVLLQSFAPVIAVGTAASVPASTSRWAALASPPVRSGRLADSDEPIGTVTSSGCSGWPRNAPLATSRAGPFGITLVTMPAITSATGSRKLACSIRAAVVSSPRAAASITSGSYPSTPPPKRSAGSLGVVVVPVVVLDRELLLDDVGLVGLVRDGPFELVRLVHLGLREVARPHVGRVLGIGHAPPPVDVASNLASAPSSGAASSARQISRSGR